MKWIPSFREFVESLSLGPTANEIVLDIDGSGNTSSNIIDIDATSLTTGSAIFIDAIGRGAALYIDHDNADTEAFNNGNGLIYYDYDKSGVVSDGITHTSVGINSNLSDSATNHANSIVNLTAFKAILSSSSNQGSNTNTGLDITVTGATKNRGIDITVPDGAGESIMMRSSADDGDFCAISTGANGVTIIQTVDDDTAAAHFEIEADGNITLDSVGNINLEPGGDVTIYDAVNDGNPTVSLGSSATNRFETKALYNSGAQTIDSIDFTTYTTSSTTNDGRYRWFVDEVELAKLRDDAFDMNGMLNAYGNNAVVQCSSSASSATDAGPEINLIMDDGAAMANDHRLGIIQFKGAEDGSNTRTTGAQIEAFCEAAWSASENGGRMVFSTTDGNANTSTVLTLDSDKKATFTGPIACTTRTLAVTSSTDGDANGDVVYFGGTTSMTVGKIYHYKSDGTWEIANADAVATSDGLLGVALGAASDTNGMLLRGMVTLDHDPGAIGDVLYVQSDNAGTPGNATATAPSASGDCVRVIGYQVSHASNGNIWFNPDNTFVEVA
jgi:hypothetical protein